jgi:D-alanine-D-alanine ligase
LPLFVKAANSGSSVGVSKVRQLSELKAAVQDSFKYDSKVIVEESIKGREIECAVMGSAFPRVAETIGEIVPAEQEYYSYDAKYISDNGVSLVAPAGMDNKTQKVVLETATNAYKCLECRGLSRVDMFLTESGEIYVNEINTLPGFTSISMYPKLWELSGINYKDLITRLIESALER